MKGKTGSHYPLSLPARGRDFCSRAIRTPDVELILNKLSTLFWNRQTNWVEVDFSKWGSGNEGRIKFSTLQTAILENHVIPFDYFSPQSEKSKRTVEPYKLLFKERSWYLYGFCCTKQEYRTFKITQMKDIAICCQQPVSRSACSSL